MRIVMAVAAVVFMMMNAMVDGAPTIGAGCMNCHTVTTGRIAITGYSSMTALPNRLDGGTTAALQTYTVTPGQTAHLSWQVLNGANTYAAVISGLSHTGVENNALDVLHFTADPTWINDTGNNPPYYEDGGGYTSWGGSTATYTYNLPVSATTPLDYYSLVLQASGADTGGEWTQMQEVYVDVVPEPGSLAIIVVAALARRRPRRLRSKMPRSTGFVHMPMLTL